MGNLLFFFSLSNLPADMDEGIPCGSLSHIAHSVRKDLDCIAQTVLHVNFPNYTFIYCRILL